PGTAHPDLADAVGRPALELHHQRSAPRFPVDPRFAVGDARAGIAEGGHLAQRTALRVVPFRLAEGLAAAQRPGVAHALEDCRRLRVLARGPAEAQVDLPDLGPFPGLKRQPHDPGLLAFLDREVDASREVA